MKNPNKRHPIQTAIYYVLIGLLILIVGFSLSVPILSHLQNNSGHFKEYRAFEKEIKKQFPVISDVQMDNDSASTSFILSSDYQLSREEILDIFDSFHAFVTQDTVWRQIHGASISIYFDHGEARYAHFYARQKKLRDHVNKNTQFLFGDENDTTDQYGVWSYRYDAGDTE